MNTQSPEIGGEGGGSRTTSGGTYSGSIATGSSSGVGGAGSSERQARAGSQDDRLAGDAKHLAEALFDSQKSGVANGMGGLAKALRRAGDELEQQHQESVGRYVDWAADRLEGLADTMRHKNVSGVVADAADLARRQPALFLGGAIVLGFGLARVLKSSARRPHDDTHGSEGSRRSEGNQAAEGDRYGDSGRESSIATSTSTSNRTSSSNPLDRTISGADPAVGVIVTPTGRGADTSRGGTL